MQGGGVLDGLHQTPQQRERRRREAGMALHGLGYGIKPLPTTYTLAIDKINNVRIFDHRIITNNENFTGQ